MEGRPRVQDREQGEAMSDHIEAIIAGLENCCAECADRAEHIAYAINEHAEVIITTPADDAAHDAAVAARTLRNLAYDLEPYYVEAWILRQIRMRAVRIEREGGSDV